MKSGTKDKNPDDFARPRPIEALTVTLLFSKTTAVIIEREQEHREVF